MNHSHTMAYGPPKGHGTSTDKQNECGIKISQDEMIKKKMVYKAFQGRSDSDEKRLQNINLTLKDHSHFNFIK